MGKKILVLDAKNFSNLKEFYVEAYRVLMRNPFPRCNLDGFNDILRGGFGRFEYDESIIIIWKNAKKSRLDLGYQETIYYFEEKVKNCHSFNIKSVQEELELAKTRKGKTIFDILIEIIRSHKNIELVLK